MKPCINISDFVYKEPYNRLDASLSSVDSSLCVSLCEQVDYELAGDLDTDLSSPVFTVTYSVYNVISNDTVRNIITTISQNKYNGTI